MVIVGGAGNNLGAMFGASIIYLVWVMSEPVTLLLFQQARTGQQPSAGRRPDVAYRALQMRVFVLGLVITLALRFAPRGLMPEKSSTTIVEGAPAHPRSAAGQLTWPTSRKPGPAISISMMTPGTSP